MNNTLLETPAEQAIIKYETAWNILQPLSEALALLPAISLQEMNEVKLMNRIDSKYLVATSYLPELIIKLSDHYAVQTISGNHIARYKTRYLDTERYTLFLDHVNGKLNHLKWRIRSYVDSDIHFLEIKKKSNKGRTEKRRIQCLSDSGILDSRSKSFIEAQDNLHGELLQPVLQNNFNRITLVNKNKSERLTIDFHISFTNCLNQQSFMVSNLAIVELKQDNTVNSYVAEVLADKRIKKSGISKYCLGMVLTSDRIKSNIYKQKLRAINKITRHK